ncbi:selenocysteine-specific translation elongation factor [Marinobacter zhanjiangensis]|uniref:Selenocysteine-specific elongation factor n=1 Tax=Marinobacter zhanjiangensis TaxID=578215 RepID=A0ABQ3B4U1_9GAMM|nr:selenocysteine-specific translation elongation factor [Marinobacter zhanjiangensis]GGY78288.1 selenocysteine-specific translation factor [Marinobacter zhanjiangensis]
MIIATAGHVDHGKTTLIHALTGQDTDRLAEEKRRGLTIDLGFAWSRTEQGHWLGFVDVPGHEKFIRNMVAGVAAVDAVMLVIAADDGPMPQTREHLAILDLLGVDAGLVALTRADRVNSSRLAGVTEEVRELLGGTALANAPVFPVSGLTGEGLPPLKAWLADQALIHQRQSGSPAAGTRFVVDRSFSVTGRGCVVTGTLVAGTLSREDALTVSPAGHPVRVRGLEAHGEAVESLMPGQRCAINLAGEVGHDHIHRGDWLVAPWLHRPTDRLDVGMALLPDTRLHRGTFQVHLGAAVRSARVVVLEEGQGNTPMLAQLMLEQPVQACVGDRLILRDPALNRTIGGGQVVDPFGEGRGRSTGKRVQLLRTLLDSQAPATHNPEDDSYRTRLQAWLEAHSEGINLDRFAAAENLPAERMEPTLAALEPVTIQTGTALVGFAPEHWATLQIRVLEQLDQWHEDHPDKIGPTEPELTRLPGIRLHQELRHELLHQLLAAEEIARNGFRFHRPGHQAKLAEADQRLLDKVMAELEGTGLKPPIVGELAEALGIERETMLAFLGRMHKLGLLVAVAPNRFYRPETVTELAAIAVELAENSPTGAFDARAYRDRSGIGRRLTVSVLEYLDRAGVTAFINEERRLQPAYKHRSAVTLSTTNEKGYTSDG